MSSGRSDGCPETSTNCGACNGSGSGVLVDGFLWTYACLLCSPLTTDCIIGLEFLKRLPWGRVYGYRWPVGTVAHPLIRVSKRAISTKKVDHLQYPPFNDRLLYY
jgi:hypothetical protein